MAEHIDKDEIKAQIKAQLDRNSRNPFTEILADGLANKPTERAWRKLAKDPDRWTRAINGLAKPAGFGEKVETTSVTVDLTDAVNALIARHGADTAAQICSQMGLPQSLTGIATLEAIPTQSLEQENPAEAHTESHE